MPFRIFSKVFASTLPVGFDRGNLSADLVPDVDIDAGGALLGSSGSNGVFPMALSASGFRAGSC
jgi:hypothetical protein